MDRPDDGRAKEEEETVFYQSDTLYEITINPRGQHMRMIPKNRLRSIYASLKEHLESYEGILEYELYPEISEPRYGNIDRGSEPRVHYHGTIRFYKDIDVGEFLYIHLYKLKKYADYCINAYREDYWPKYCKKQEVIMLKLCKKYSVPYKLHNKSKFFIIRTNALEDDVYTKFHLDSNV